MLVISHMGSYLVIYDLIYNRIWVYMIMGNYLRFDIRSWTIIYVPIWSYITVYRNLNWHIWTNMIAYWTVCDCPSSYQVSYMSMYDHIWAHKNTSQYLTIIVHQDRICLVYDRVCFIYNQIYFLYGCIGNLWNFSPGMGPRHKVPNQHDNSKRFLTFWDDFFYLKYRFL